ncbi:hypothetical protein [Bacillus thuringiensis]|uniref:hypothetical protein n=1 Tax=Bacillus thuringiensis TaxID=1428 RepID=UPI002D8073B4|nr:hypothetical protein [Bacillus thuringiensis]MEB4820303.1 hypothetical protein [Bacillus thuringiensis]
MKKKILALTVPLLFSAALTTQAATPNEGEVHNLLTTPPSGIIDNTNLKDDVQRGPSPPGSNASLHNIGISSYSYQVGKVGAQIYTDKWLTGQSTMRISINNWRVLDNYGGTSNQVTVKVYNSSGSVVRSETRNAYDSSAVYFSGLSSSQKYYVGFHVPTNGNTYSFNGSIY